MPAAIGEIEAMAAADGVSLAELAVEAEVPVATLRRMRRTGLAFPRQVVALRLALRRLRREQRLMGADDGA